MRTHPAVAEILSQNAQTVEVSGKKIFVDGNVRNAYDKGTLSDIQMRAVEFLCQQKTYDAVTRTTLATWTENPLGLSEGLKTPLENFLKAFAGKIRDIIGNTHTLPQAPEPSWNIPGDIREVPQRDELLKVFIFGSDIAHIEAKRVEKFLKENAHVIMALIGEEQKETSAIAA